ncbi:hypothetical protein OENI_30001 [Oenococcus oeni]|nr:hypothetical protein OENI_30001 [Oenococcus oeni]
MKRIVISYKYFRIGIDSQKNFAFFAHNAVNVCVMTQFLLQNFTIECIEVY